MTRRADHRRTLICCALELDGPATLHDLACALRRPQLLVWNDLTVLEEAGAVVTEWAQRPGRPDGALIVAYRLMTLDDQDAAEAERAATEERVRAALHWYADSVEPQWPAERP